MVENIPRFPHADASFQHFRFQRFRVLIGRRCIIRPPGEMAILKIGDVPKWPTKYHPETGVIFRPYTHRAGIAVPQSVKKKVFGTTLWWRLLFSEILKMRSAAEGPPYFGVFRPYFLVFPGAWRPFATRNYRTDEGASRNAKWRLNMRIPNYKKPYLGIFRHNFLIFHGATAPFATPNWGSRKIRNYCTDKGRRGTPRSATERLNMRNIRKMSAQY